MDKCLRAEFTVASPRPASILNACGVIIVNPPWRLAAEIRTFAPALLHALGCDNGRGYRLDDLAPPASRASC
jgi:23S rRNA (adenine2030-N6)-methyltransferase